jgi:hypothetical protein
VAWPRAQQRGLGQAQQEAGLHHVRQHPAGVGGHGGVEVVQRRRVEHHHQPQGALDRVACAGAGAAAGVAADVRVGHVP